MRITLPVSQFLDHVKQSEAILLYMTHIHHQLSLPEQAQQWNEFRPILSILSLFPIKSLVLYFKAPILIIYPCHTTIQSRLPPSENVESKFGAFPVVYRYRYRSIKRSRLLSSSNVISKFGVRPALSWCRDIIMVYFFAINRRLSDESLTRNAKCNRS
jgi:hypothetical protein